MSQTISVSLPSDVLYVSGTVNAVPVTWTNTEGNIWEAVADRAANDVYVVELTLVNALGSTTMQTLTLYYGLHLITDRTQEDVNLVLTLRQLGSMTEEERALWDGDLKGAYNAGDLNRVGAAMQYLKERFTQQGYLCRISPVIDWATSDIPSPADAAAYLGNVSTLRGMFALPAGTPSVPADMEKFSYQEANNIERILEVLDQLLTNSIAAAFYSGDLYAGEI